MGKDRFFTSEEKEIVTALDKGEKVYIESGAANDEIVGYEIDVRKRKIYGQYLEWQERVVYITTACIFPTKVETKDFDYVEIEEIKGSLFVEVR